MAKRYNISLPDALAEKYEKHKKGISLSLICQDAILERITDIETTEELAQAGIKRPEVIKRLRSEREAAIKELRREGHTAGVEWSKKACYSDLAKVLSHTEYRWVFRSDNAISDLFWRDTTLFDVFAQFAQEASDARVWYNLTNNDNNCFTSDGLVWARGFVRGVRDFYESIKEDLEKE